MSESENDPALTQAQLKRIEKLCEADLVAIDAALLSNASIQYRKITRVIGATMSNMEGRIKGIPDIFYAQRIIRLIENGSLDGQGNIKKMRFSEVRKPR